MSDFDEIRAICERQAAKAKRGKPSTCGTCSGDGLMWWPAMKEGKPDWYVLQCLCGQADLGPHVPIWPEFRSMEGRPPDRNDVYTSSERDRFDSLVAARPDEYAREEREAIQETDYSFEGAVSDGE